MTETNPSIDRRTIMKALSVTGAIGLAGCVGSPGDTQTADTPSGAGGDEDQSFEDAPEIEIPVIDGYNDGGKVWFIHTSTSDEKMAKRLTEMIDYPTLHVPKLDDIVKLDELANIHAFKNGVDKSEAEPWGGGPFGYQIDLFRYVPDDPEYTPLHQPHVVTWRKEADPRVLQSYDELMAVHDAGELEITPTDVVVTAPLVSWPGDPFSD